MFSNIGNKIRVLAKVLCIIGIVVSGLAGFAMLCGGIAMLGNRYTIGAGFAIMFAGILTAGLGVLFSWIGSFVLYGYGQLIHSVQSIEKKVLGDEYEDYEATPATFASAPAANPAVKVCPNCNTANASDAKFCIGCGTTLN